MTTVRGCWCPGCVLVCRTASPSRPSARRAAPEDEQTVRDSPCHRRGGPADARGPRTAARERACTPRWSGSRSSPLSGLRTPAAPRGGGCSGRRRRRGSPGRLHQVTVVMPGGLGDAADVATVTLVSGRARSARPEVWGQRPCQRVGALPLQVAAPPEAAARTAVLLTCPVAPGLLLFVGVGCAVLVGRRTTALTIRRHPAGDGGGRTPRWLTAEADLTTVGTRSGATAREKVLRTLRRHVSRAHAVPGQRVPDAAVRREGG